LQRGRTEKDGAGEPWIYFVRPDVMQTSAFVMKSDHLMPRIDKADERIPVCSSPLSLASTFHRHQKDCENAAGV